MAGSTYVDFMRKELGSDAMKRPISREELYEFIEGLVGEFADTTKALRDRVDQLEKSGARFRGVYQRASDYRRGDQATHKGSLWTALQDAPEGTVPGESSGHWQLAAKGTG